MKFEKLNASTFYLTTMGENQAPARLYQRPCAKKNFGWLLSMEGGKGISATEVGELKLLLGSKVS